MALPWMNQLSLHGAGSKSSLLKAAADLLRETHQELQEESQTDPGHLSLISIGPTGERQLIGEFGSPGSLSSEDEKEELILSLNDAQDRRIEVGALRITGLEPNLYIQDKYDADSVPSHGRRFGRLVLLLHLFREVSLLEAANRVRAEIRTESNPHNIRRFRELRGILERFTERVIEILGRQDVLCYLRRSYLPYETGDGHWPKRHYGYAIYLPPPALEAASQKEWERFWDTRGNALEGGGGESDPGGAPPAGDYYLYDFPLLVIEAKDQDVIEQEGGKLKRFYGALACFSCPPYGYLESEQGLLKSLAEDLALLVRDCEIQHHMSVHEQLLFDRNFIESSDAVLKASIGWFIDLYCPVEIAVLRLEGGHLNPIYTHGINRLKVPPLDILTSPGGVLRAARERTIDYIAKTQEDPNYLLVNPETRSQIAVPLYSGEILMGVLLLGFPVVDAIGPTDRLLILACSFRIAAALWRAEKTRLGSMVTHKLKEILPLLRDNLELLARATQKSAKEERILSRCLDVLKYWEPRIAILTHAIYQDRSLAEPFDLKDMLEKLVVVYSAKGSESSTIVELVISFEGSYPVRGREQAVEMAFDALASNALEAMSEIGGKLVFHLFEPGVRHSDPYERKFVRVRVEDDGPGIPPEIHHQIFEPLFTTKSGNSTGLGLFIARGVFEGIGGTLELIPESDPDRKGKKGAAFDVRLPISDPDA